MGSAGSLVAAIPSSTSFKSGVRRDKRNFYFYFLLREDLTVLLLLLLQEDDGSYDFEGQGAATLSLRSQTKLIPEVLSYVASEGKLGKRQPDSKEKYR